MRRNRNQDRMQERMRRFEDRWRELSHRPPRQDAREAARRIVARLDEVHSSVRRPGFELRTWRFAAVAAVTVLALGLWLLLPGLPPTTPGPDLPAPAAESETPVVADGVVLLWLDAETPLYMTFAPPTREPDAEKGEGS